MLAKRIHAALLVLDVAGLDTTVLGSVSWILRVKRIVASRAA